ncbi:dephospho-CoA kinase [Sanyastnella coralliicola]|uniref:dephospho-CoA kinase n=1 Tax=Sanyastnella coralliicola TaxID=3069118 RepID=UPI0027B9E028|nr:dephospho-CoA kinase [Longitalea sp. SCSIO 12813]
MNNPTQIIGLTGGIGSGKSTVAKIFECHGIPIYKADDHAKDLYTTDLVMKEQVIQEFGEKVYKEGQLDRAYLASVVFANAERLQALNAIVHPAVARHFQHWLGAQRAPCIIREAAILFESGSYKDCDAVITVNASEELRIERSIARDTSTRQQIEDRISKQWTDDQRQAKADFIITNNLGDLLIPQVNQIIEKITG